MALTFDKTEIEKNLTLFLYPDDSDDKGRLLRVYQQYFMVSNAAQLILDECIARGSNLHDLADYAAVQINDTHPSMVIPELIRLLGQHGILMDDSVIVAVRSQTDGKDLTTTINSSLQKAIYEQYKNDKSAHVALNPSTGEVKALVSTPSYDAQAFILGMSQKKWNVINSDQRLPMQNRFKATFAPGSSIKPIIAAIGLSQNKFRANDDFGNSGKRWQKDKSWGGYYVTTLHDYNGHNLQNAMIYSDNIYFAKAALKIGKDTLKDQLDNLGFGESLKFTFGLNASSYGSEGFTSDIQLADSGYGQGKMMVNPVHMAAIYTAFSNNGNMLKPYLVKENGSKKQVLKETIFTKQAVNTVNEAMRQVIRDPSGTGHAANIEGVDLRGKTGTARDQTITDRHKRNRNRLVEGALSAGETSAEFFDDSSPRHPHGCHPCGPALCVSWW